MHSTNLGHNFNLQALTLTAALLDDLTSEVADRKGGDEESSSQAAAKIEPASFDLFAAFTATQR